MRLWHKDLITYLPKQQLLAQWRECCAICSNWANKGTPNHLLVNKVMEYSPIEFVEYSMMVTEELEKRAYEISKKSKKNFGDNYNKLTHYYIYNNTKIFKYWHNERYLKQCLFNLQEKYDCGGIPENEWKMIEEKFGEYLKSNSELEKEVEKLREFKRTHQPLYIDSMSC